MAKYTIKLTKLGTSVNTFYYNSWDKKLKKEVVRSIVLPVNENGDINVNATISLCTALYKTEKDAAAKKNPLDTVIQWEPNEETTS